MLKFLAVTAVLFLCGLDAGAQDYNELEKKVSRLRKELAQVQGERAEVGENMAEDKANFDEYQKRMKSRMNRLKSETDSILSEIGQSRGVVDSLSALVASKISSQKQYVMLQEGFSRKLQESADYFIKKAYEMPPMVSNQTVVALQFLKSEISAKEIDNIEGLARILKITEDMETVASNIQIVQGSSPVPQISGTAYRLRIGTIFEAVVDAKGEKYALWQGIKEDGTPEWLTGEDPETAARILSAVKIREGKSVPEFVPLPFAHNKGEEGEK
ncbi:MAG: DUF3450 family protein [Fibrobacterota bacterium]